MQAEPGELAGCRGPPVSAQHRPRPGATTSLRRKEDPRPPPAHLPHSPMGRGCPHLPGLRGRAGPRRAALEEEEKGSGTAVWWGRALPPRVSRLLPDPPLSTAECRDRSCWAAPQRREYPALLGLPPHPGYHCPREATEDRGPRQRTPPLAPLWPIVSGTQPAPTRGSQRLPRGPSARLVAPQGAQQGRERGSRGRPPEAALPDLKFISSVVKR